MDLIITIVVFIAAIIMFSITKWGAPRTATSIKDAVKIAKNFGEVQNIDQRGFGLKTELGQWVICKTSSNNWKVMFPDFWSMPLEVTDLFQKMAAVNAKLPFAKITLESSEPVLISCSDLHVLNKKTLGFSLRVMHDQVVLWGMINSEIPEEVTRSLPPEIKALVSEFSGEEATMGFQ